MELDENVIVRSCPNLEKLSLCGGIVDVQLDFSDYRFSSQPVPTLNCHWHNVQDLTADLSDTTNPLSKCVQRLHFRLNDRCDGWKRKPGGYNSPSFADDMQAILHMLTVNRHLAYVDVLVLSTHRKYRNAFKKQNVKPINRPAKLCREVKLAFLSVVSPSHQGRTDQDKRARETLPRRNLLGDLNQRLVSHIFEFAAPQLLRQVYFRTTEHYWYADEYDDEFDEDDGDY